jgi:hypothetical protein
MGKQETSPQQEPQDPHFIDFQTFGYDKDDPLAKPMQDRLQRAGSQKVVQVASVFFGSDVAAYAARAITEQEFKDGEGTTLIAFREGTYAPADENTVRLLIGIDIAQRLRDTKHADEKILELFGKKTDEGTVYERLHTTADKDLATLHRRLQHRVELIYRESHTEKPPQRTQTKIYEKKRRRG